MINIKVDQKRLSDILEVDEYLALLEGDAKTMVNVLSRFVVDDSGNYLDPAEGRKLIGRAKLTELKEVAQAFLGNADKSAVPLANDSA